MLSDDEILAKFNEQFNVDKFVIFPNKDKKGGLTETNQSSNTGDIIPADSLELNKEPVKKDITKPFSFSNKALNIYCDVVYNHIIANFRQIELKALQNFSFLMSYGGLNINPFYVLDLSVTGTGKTSNEAIQRDLLLDVVLDRQIQKTKDFKKDEANKDKKAFFINIHDDLSKGGFESSLQNEAVQMVVIDEYARTSKDQVAKPLLTSILKQHGKKAFNIPTYKNNTMDQQTIIKNVKLYSYFATTIITLGVDNFIYETQTGDLNRPITIFTNKKLKNKKHRDISKGIKDRYYDYSNALIEFCKKFKYSRLKDNDIQDNKIFDEFRQWHDKQEELLPDEYADFFARADYNFIAIAETLHFLAEFERYNQEPNKDNFIISNSVSDELLYETFEFLKYYYSFDELIEKIANKEYKNSEFIKRDRLIKYIAVKKRFNKSISIETIRAGNRHLNLNANEIKNLLQNHVIFNENQTEILAIK